MVYLGKRTYRQAFTLLEVMGVLVVIGVLTALLFPTILGAIRSAAVTQTAASLNSLKAACASHAAQFGGLATDGSASPPAPIALDGSDPRAAQFDKVLLWESLLDSPFAPKIGDGINSPTNIHVQIVSALSPSTVPTQDNSAYDLDGTGVNETTGVAVVEAVITGVSLEDAKALNDVLDGNSLGLDTSGNDLRGRVKYAVSNGASGNGGVAGHGNGNGLGLGHGAGNGGQNNGNGSGGSDSGSGNGGNGNGNQNSGGGNGTTSVPTTVTVHVYITHR